MNNVKLNLNEHGRGAFTISDGDEKLGEMVVGISGTNLTAYHTEVDAKAEGKGLAKILLGAMVSHARENHLKVIPLCSYVHAQLKRHATEYADIWHQEKEM